MNDTNRYCIRSANPMFFYSGDAEANHLTEQYFTDLEAATMTFDSLSLSNDGLLRVLCDDVGCQVLLVNSAYRKAMAVLP